METGLTMFAGQYDELPENIKEALHNYVKFGHHMGHFLTAVAANDLFKAVGHADAESIPQLKNIVQWFYNVAPTGCHGGPSAVREWQAHRGLAELEVE